MTPFDVPPSEMGIDPEIANEELEALLAGHGRDKNLVLTRFVDDLSTAFPAHAPATTAHLAAISHEARLLADNGGSVARPASNAVASPRASRLPKRWTNTLERRKARILIKIAAPVVALFAVLGIMGSAGALPRALQHLTSNAAGIVGLSLPTGDDSTGTTDTTDQGDQNSQGTDTKDATDQGDQDNQGDSTSADSTDQGDQNDQGDSTSSDSGSSDSTGGGFSTGSSDSADQGNQNDQGDSGSTGSSDQGDQTNQGDSTGGTSGGSSQNDQGDGGTTQDNHGDSSGESGSGSSGSGSGDSGSTSGGSGSSSGDNQS
jgi:hypothetical protein